MALKSNTIAALDRCFAATGCYAITSVDDRLTITLEHGRSFQAHRVGDVWISAKWDENYSNWRSYDLRKGANALYCYARNITDLAAEVRTHKTAFSAIYAAAEPLGY